MPKKVLLSWKPRLFAFLWGVERISPDQRKASWTVPAPFAPPYRALHEQPPH
jgi:hypothetical protein